MLDALRDAFGDRLKVDEPLAKHTSARIGGPADYFLAARSADDLATAARIGWAHDVPVRVLGGGSNILISDAGVRGLVIHNKAKAVTVTGETVSAESGLSSIRLARLCASEGLAGFEWAIGVPGTIGGAVVGNAGAHGGDMADSVVQVEALTPGGPVTWSNSDLDFAYRTSYIKREGQPCVILRVELAFRRDDPAAIKQRMDEYNAYRKRTQPPGATIGSMFKNPEGDYAGRLIEAAGLKGTQIGGAQISEKHANFFLNVDDATAADVMALADMARQRVAEQFGIPLELEIEPVGAW